MVLLLLKIIPIEKMIYIEHYSIWLDIKLLFLTFKIIFIKDNSEGFDEKTAEEMSEKMKES